MLYTLFICMLATTHSFDHFEPQHLPEKNDIKFVLITMLYNEKKEARINEYLTCLYRNMQHELIDSIHVLYDASTDDNTNTILAELKRLQLPITIINRRGSYGDCFSIANKLYPNRIIIVANADIYFNKTLLYLANYDFNNKFLAITRWDECADGNLQLFGHWNSDTQDAWIFKTPLKSIECDHIQMGVLDCDGRIAFQAKKAGLQVLNPCKTIQCCHLHLSNIRNYGERKNPYPWHEAMLVPWEYLKG